MKTEPAADAGRKWTFKAEYDSQAQFVAMTPFSLALVKQAKKEGCPAFNHSRVRFWEFVDWLVNSGDAGQSHEMLNNSHLTHFKAKLAELELEKAKGKVIEREEARRATAQLAADIFAEIERFFIDDAPGMLQGLTAVQIVEKGRPTVEALKTKIRAWQITE